MSPTSEAAALPQARRRFTLPPTLAFFGSSVALIGLFFGAGAPSTLFVYLEPRWGFPPTLLTLAFAIYSIGLLITLLFVGNLSDHIGRRPVLMAAFALGVVAMLLFVFATNIWVIILARLVQGLAVGIASSALSASIMELAPERFRKLGGTLGGVSPGVGLSLGALVGGLAVQYLANPPLAVFLILFGATLLSLLLVALAPETISGRPGALASLKPTVSVPAQAKGPFLAIIPSILGVWMFSALFLGLAPVIVHDLFHINSGLVSGLTTFVMPAASAVGGLMSGPYLPRRVVMAGNVAAVLGSAVFVLGILLTSLPLVMVGGAIGGLGFGAIHTGALRLLGGLVHGHQRAGTFSAMFVVAYLAFGVPTIIAGQLIAPLGMATTIAGFGVAIFVASIAGVLVQARHAARLKSGSAEAAA